MSISVQTPYKFTPTKSMKNLTITDPFQASNIKIVCQIVRSKPGIQLVHSQSHNKHMVLKDYELVDGEVSPYFLNESRYSFLNHKNIINICESKAKRGISMKDLQPVSSVLMEVAPYGDFASLVINQCFQPDEKIARTFFHQLIDGLEYLHSKEISHLDLKLGNLLLGENLTLKICDFEFAFQKGDSIILGCGTKNFRPPEVLQRKHIKSLKAIDIYAAGIILFTLCTGTVPYDEDKRSTGIDMMNLMLRNSEQFWHIMENKVLTKKRLSVEFKKLFESMTHEDHSTRPNIEEIKASTWYNMPIFSHEELNSLLKNSITPIL